MIGTGQHGKYGRQLPGSFETFSHFIQRQHYNQSQIKLNFAEQPKLLVLTSRFPYPLEKGDKLRVFHQIRLLSQEFSLVLVSLHETPVTAEDKAVLRKYCDQIYLLPLPKWRIALNLYQALIHNQSFQVGYFYSRTLQRKLNEIIDKEQPDHLYAQLIRTGKYVAQASIPKTIDFMDVFSGQLFRRAEHSHPLLRWLFRREAQKMATLEARLFKAFDHATIISNQDREQLAFSEKGEVVVVPNGIDTQFFKACDQEKKYDLIFVGNMGYHPNVVAAQYLVKEIMPLIWEKNESVQVLLAGARPAMEVKRLAGPRVTVSGWMDDIREAYASGRIFVAPLFLGSGQQNKILEAMSMGLPCITTPMVNNAIGGVNNKNILLAENKNEFSLQALDLLGSTQRQKEIGNAAMAFVMESFSWEQSVQKLVALIKDE